MAAKGTRTIGRLDSVAGIRRELARVYTEARRGELDTNEASKLGNLLAVLHRIIEGSALEDRLARLEEAADREPEPWKVK